MLVEAIVNMPWMTLESATVKSYTVFIGMLLSAKPEYLSLVLGKIVQNFTYQSGLQALDAGVPESSSQPLTRRLIYNRLHELLAHVLSLIPTLPSTLQPILVRHFPHKRQNQLAQATYIRNMLRISEYCPALADKILATIIDRAIQIDVEIQVELEELEDDVEDPVHDVFEFDPFDVVLGQEGDEFDSDVGEDDDFSEDEDNFSDLSSEGGEYDEPQADVPSNVRQVQEMVKKLDAILTLLFEHFKRSPSTPDALRPTFQALLSIFDRTILNTFRSRYTQFLLFWYSSLDPEFSDIFQGMLVDRALFSASSAPTAELTRAAAASYIGSFVSRATFVDGDGTRRVVGVLCDYLSAHLEEVDDAIREHGPSWIENATPSQHTVFYAVAQAVFLIFCFRWRDLQEDMEVILERGPGAKDKWIPHLKVLKRVVLSVLNPLKICSTGVVTQFAKVAHQTDFMYCFSVLESNKRSEFGTSGGGSSPSRGAPAQPAFVRVRAADHADELHTFFPFDPYRLPKSAPFIEGVYREWSSVAIDAEDDSDSDDEGSSFDSASEPSEHDDDDDDGDETLGRGYLAIPGRGLRGKGSDTDDDGGLGQSMVAMSISPRAGLASSVVMGSLSSPITIANGR